MQASKAERTRRYARPQVRTVSAREIIEALGPAQGVNGSTNIGNEVVGLPARGGLHGRGRKRH